MRNRTTRCALGCTAASLAASIFPLTSAHADLPASSASAEILVPGVESRVAHVRSPQTRPGRGLDPHAIPLVDSTTVDVERLSEEDAGRPGPARIGIVQPVDIDSRSDGIWTTLDDGSWIWAVRLRSPGARWTRVTVSRCDAPQDAELFVYSPLRPDAALGPLDRSAVVRSGRLWTPVVFGEEIAIELHVPSSATGIPDLCGVQLSQVVHGYLGFDAPGGSRGGEPLPCNLDVSCAPNVNLRDRGVGLCLLCPDQNCLAFTGTMIQRAGSGDADFTPLLLTAEHCGVTDENADSLTVFWFFQTDGCGGTVPDLHSVPQTAGATVLMGDADTDVALIGLRDDVPGGVAFLPVDVEYWGSIILLPGSCIFHPWASFKRIANFAKDGLDLMDTRRASDLECVSAHNYRCEFFIDGLMEPGGDGAPLFDGTGAVRAVVSCFPGVDECGLAQPVSGGRLDHAEPLLRPYIDPVDTVFVDRSWSGYERGTANEPLRSVFEGSFAVKRGHELRVYPGSYNERLILDKELTLRRAGSDGSVVIGR